MKLTQINILLKSGNEIKLYATVADSNIVVKDLKEGMMGKNNIYSPNDGLITIKCDEIEAVYIEHKEDGVDYK